VTTREERLARNEALFRGVNEKVKQVKQDLPSGEGEAFVDFICECGSDGCVEQIQLTLSEYEAVRSDPTHFAIKPGHDSPEVERALEDNDRYVVVEKHEEEARIARSTDPRG
jgi:hypothetical protein